MLASARIYPIFFLTRKAGFELLNYFVVGRGTANGQEIVYGRAFICIHVYLLWIVSPNGFMQLFLSYSVTGEDASPCNPSSKYPDNLQCIVLKN